ncbi:MAG: hypothetical protein GX846_04925 [Deltaproteobacteria bacterium]|nr:hypothetical protein [Deltaproteobacteria bacterium]
MNYSRVAYCSLVPVLVLMFAACGYRFRAEGKPVGIEIESIAVPLIESTASEKGFEADFTTALRNRFISHGRIPLKSVEMAQMILRVQVYEILTEPVIYDSAKRTVSGREVVHKTTGKRRLTVSLSASLTDRGTGNTVWSDPSITEETNFNITSDPLINRKNQRDALLKIVRFVSERLFNQTMERF